MKPTRRIDFDQIQDQVSARSNSSSAAGCSRKGFWHQQMPFAAGLVSDWSTQVAPKHHISLHIWPSTYQDILGPTEFHNLPANAKAPMVRLGPERRALTWCPRTDVVKSMGDIVVTQWRYDGDFRKGFGRPSISSIGKPWIPGGKNGDTLDTWHFNIHNRPWPGRSNGPVSSLLAKDLKRLLSG